MHSLGTIGAVGTSPSTRAAGGGAALQGAAEATSVGEGIQEAGSQGWVPESPVPTLPGVCRVTGIWCPKSGAHQIPLGSAEEVGMWLRGTEPWAG